MKLFLISLSMISIFVATQKSEACTPPRFLYEMQAVETRALFSNSAVDAKIIELAGAKGLVESVKYENGGYIITLSNKSQLFAVPVWEVKDSTGPCPALAGFKIR